MNKFILMASAALIATMMTSGANAQNMGGRAAMFDMLDQNGDGVISREEFMAHTHEKGGQSMMQGQGMKQGQGMGGQGKGGKNMMEMFATIDEDENGQISAMEMTEFQEGVYAAMDGDDNGMVTMEEYMSVRMGPGAGNEQAGAAMSPGQMRKQQRFAGMDKNGDHMLSNAEFMQHGKDEVKQLDQNGDGMISMEEFKNHN